MNRKIEFLIKIKKEVTEIDLILIQIIEMDARIL